MPQIRKVYIHVGAHKTGSTWIQTALKELEVSLLRNNIYIPKSGLASSELAAHHNIAFELNRNRRFVEGNGTMKQLMQEIHNTKNDILLSSEDFCFTIMNIEYFKDLVKLFDEKSFQLNWILYLRNVPDFINSNYSNLAQFLHIDVDLKAWIKTGIGIQSNKYIMNPNLLIQNIAIRKNDKIFIRSFDLAKKNGLLKDFLFCLGISEELEFENIALNQSATNYEVEFCKIISTFLNKYKLNGYSIDLIARSRKAFRLLPKGEKYIGFDSESAIDIIDACKDNYAKISDVSDININELLKVKDYSYNELNFENFDKKIRSMYNEAFFETVFGSQAFCESKENLQHLKNIIPISAH